MTAHVDAPALRRSLATLVDCLGHRISFVLSRTGEWQPPDAGQYRSRDIRTHGRAGDRQEHAYFVRSQMVSVVATANDHQVEVGMAAHEVMVGLGIVLGVDRSSSDCVVQSP
jgi:hypothetical protein